MHAQVVMKLSLAMLGHKVGMFCTKFHKNRLIIDGEINPRKACAPDNCVIDFSSP